MNKTEIIKKNKNLKTVGAKIELNKNKMLEEEIKTFENNEWMNEHIKMKMKTHREMIEYLINKKINKYNNIIKDINKGLKEYELKYDNDSDEQSD